MRMVWLTPGHGQPVHRRRQRAPAFHRPPGAQPRPRLCQRRRRRSTAPCASVIRRSKTLSPPRLLDGIEAQMAEAAAEDRRHPLPRRAKPRRGNRRRARARAGLGVPLGGAFACRASRSANRYGRARRVRDAYARLLATSRERDRAAARTLTGPHRSDLEVHHGPNPCRRKCARLANRRRCSLGLRSPRRG